MEIKLNIDRKSSVFIIVIVGLLIVIAVLFGSRNNSFWPMSWMHHDDFYADTEKVNSGKLDGVDIMFAQMMIPHHEQAITMAELVAARSNNDQVKSLALEIIAAQGPEIAQMKSWLNQAKRDLAMGHSMGMHGVLTDKELSEMKSASGANFDRLFLEGMIAHHKGAILMAEMIENSDHREVRKLGEAIRITQTIEIELMESLLKSIN